MAEETTTTAAEIDTGAAAASEGMDAASSAGDDFLAGFFGEDEEATEPQAEEATEGNTEETANPEPEQNDQAESPAEPAKVPEMVTFTEHGKNYQIEREILSGFAKAVGRTPEEVIGLYQKGCGFDALNERYQSAVGDSDIIESLAKMMGKTVDQQRAELKGSVERFPIDQMKEMLMAKNPSLTEAEAERWATAEIEARKAKEASSEEAKAKAEAEKRNAADEEYRAGKVREIEAFGAAHPEIKPEDPLPAEVVEAFQNGKSLEDAYQSYLLKRQVEDLQKENETLRTAKKKAEQQGYARSHAAGSAATNAAAEAKDPFLVGLFGE